MRAGFLLAPSAIEVRETAQPHAPPGGIVVRVRAALTDGTDLKAFRRGHPQMPMPTVFGHEFSGDVALAGTGAPFAVGEPVMSVHSAPCGACFWCTHAQEELCAHVMETKVLGAYAQYVAIPAHIVARNAMRKPAHLSYEAAAFLEPLSCVVHSFDILAPSADARVAIVGSGGFGLLHALVAGALKLPPTLLIGRSAERNALARRLGIHVIEAGVEARAAVLAATEGRGADAVIECTGSAAVWQDAATFVRRGGTVSLFGGLAAGTRVAFEAAKIHYDELRIVSPFHFTPRDVRRAFELLDGGAIDVMPLVSGSFPLERLADAFAALESGRGVKFAILP